MKNKIKEILNNDQHKKQITKFLYAAIMCIGLLLFVEGLFQIPAINNLFDAEAIGNEGTKITAWVVLWLLMFAQVTIIPIPAMPIYVFCSGTTLVANGTGLLDLFSIETVFFCVFVVSACVAGSIVAYWLGRLGGGKAVRWIAGDEDDYNQWCKILNNKKGKVFYACTVLFPLFPDDIICLVVGAMKMDFKYFTIVNIIGKLIGAFATLLFIRLPILSDFFTSSRGGGIPWSIIIYSALMLILTIITIIWKKKVDKKSV